MRFNLTTTFSFTKADKVQQPEKEKKNKTENKFSFPPYIKMNKKQNFRKKGEYL